METTNDTNLHELIEETTDLLIHPSDEFMNRRNAFSIRGLREIRGPSFLFPR